MTHPLRLHAAAALHSLAAAWPHLQRAQRAAAAATADDGDRGTLRAWAPNSGGSGGSGPARSAVLEAVIRPTVEHPVLRLYDQATGAVWWIADELGLKQPDTVPATLALLLGVAVRVPPPVAGRLARHADDEDRKIRDLLKLGDDHAPLTGVDCPACGVRDLAWRTSAPPAQRVVVCRAGCLCAGAGCRCGMGVLEAGVAHVWTADQVTAREIT